MLSPLGCARWSSWALEHSVREFSTPPAMRSDVRFRFVPTVVSDFARVVVLSKILLEVSPEPSSEDRSRHDCESIPFLCVE